MMNEEIIISAITITTNTLIAINIIFTIFWLILTLKYPKSHWLPFAKKARNLSIKILIGLAVIMLLAILCIRYFIL